MSASRAVVATGGAPGPLLANFSDEIVVKMELHNPDRLQLNWILMASVIVANIDSSSQFGEAKLLHDANVEIINTRHYFGEKADMCITLFAALTTDRDEIVTLECNTYYGVAHAGRIVAMCVDNIEIQ